MGAGAALAPVAVTVDAQEAPCASSDARVGKGLELLHDESSACRSVRRWPRVEEIARYACATEG